MHMRFDCTRRCPATFGASRFSRCSLPDKTKSLPDGINLQAHQETLLIQQYSGRAVFR